MRPLIEGLIILLFAAGLAGCDSDGPAERAGEAIDDTAEEIQEAGEEAADEMEDAVE